MGRTCSDCPKGITAQSKTGRCHACAMKRQHADPSYQAKRLEKLRDRLKDPAIRAARTRHLQKVRENLTPEQIERRREHGRWLAREVLTPERRAKAQLPEAKARAVAKMVETRMGWCPAELRPDYHRLIRSLRYTAAEARRIIEAEIPGTAAHAARELANHSLSARLRAERDRSQAY